MVSLGASASCTKNSLSAGTIGDARRIVRDGQCVEAVNDQTERIVVRCLHDAPGVTPSVDMAPPGEGLVPDAQPATPRTFRHFRKIGCGAGVVVECGGMDVAAHQHQIRAERLHHIELAFGTIHVACALRLRHRLEVAERLEDRDCQAQAFCDGTHVRGRSVEGQQIVLEHFDAVESDGGGGIQLFRQRAAQGYCGDGFQMAR